MKTKEIIIIFFRKMHDVQYPLHTSQQHQIQSQSTTTFYSQAAIAGAKTSVTLPPIMGPTPLITTLPINNPTSVKLNCGWEEAKLSRRSMSRSRVARAVEIVSGELLLLLLFDLFELLLFNLLDFMLDFDLLLDWNLL